jgi:hypothetical protein
MADNITTVNAGTGALPNATMIATRDSGSGHWQQVDVGPAPSTVVAGSQHALSVGTGAPTTLTVPATATHAWLSVDSGGAATGIRYTFDGTTPTASVGHFLAAGDALTFVDSLVALKMLGVTGTATIQVSYFKFI